MDWRRWVGVVAVAVDVIVAVGGVVVVVGVW